MPPNFKKIKELVLGLQYDLSFSYVTPAQMRSAMQYKYKSRRKVGTPTKASGKVSNVLSFPYTPTSGEILICKSAAKPYSSGYLFIHGCLHLKGLKHNATMEREEIRILKKFGLRAHE